MTFRALSNRWIWDSVVESSLADVASNTEINRLTSSAIESLWATKAGLNIDTSRPVSSLVSASRAVGLTFASQVAVATLNTIDWFLALNLITVLSLRASCADSKASLIRVEAILAVHFVDKSTTAVFALSALSSNNRGSSGVIDVSVW